MTFNVGDRIQDIRDRTKVGTVAGQIELVHGAELILVRWENGKKLERLRVAFLAPYKENWDLWGLLKTNAFGGREDFVRNYTHRKLLKPVDDTLYTLHASRTALLPHQFKPLLRFLDSIHRRYLIADEVGLGKTIEAGIIISELRARNTLGGVLILWPNHLRNKWQRELLVRFDEHFDIISERQRLLRLLDQADDAPTSGARWIVGPRQRPAKACFSA